ncbi:hypothetical protein L1987_10694 [Smallanthus sonchifolius]|uniref:Uncharacterized protein n=1 Tax=Smallanthus sonchifolius TaxID=185202 RepID=A0ACB9J8S9_9ASTR|nr:hypothetical protein L1987_10694 [Smallanthus sonchifolius]
MTVSPGKDKLNEEHQEPLRPAFSTGDYVKIKCIESGSPTESIFAKGVVYTTSTGNGSFEDGCFKSRSSLSKCVISGKVFRLCYVSKLLRRTSKSTSKIFINSLSYMRISGKKSLYAKATDNARRLFDRALNWKSICWLNISWCLIKKKHLQYKQAEKGCISASETQLRNQPG